MNDDGEALREHQFTEAMREAPRYSCAECQGDIEYEDEVWVEVAQKGGGSKPYHVGCAPEVEHD